MLRAFRRCAGGVLNTVSDIRRSMSSRRAAEDLGDPGGDARVGQQVPLHTGAVHDADDDLVEGFGVVVVHPLAEQDHLGDALTAVRHSTIPDTTRDTPRS